MKWPNLVRLSTIAITMSTPRDFDNPSIKSRDMSSKRPTGFRLEALYCWQAREDIGCHTSHTWPIPFPAILWYDLKSPNGLLKKNHSIPSSEGKYTQIWKVTPICPYTSEPLVQDVSLGNRSSLLNSFSKLNDETFLHSCCILCLIASQSMLLNETRLNIPFSLGVLLPG